MASIRWKCLFVGLLAVLIAVGPAAAQELQWTRQIGTSGFDVARAIGVHETGVYAFGSVADPEPSFPGETDVFLTKYDFAGNELWTRQFGPDDDFPMAGQLAFDDTGVYVAGITDGTLAGETNAGSYDVFVRKYDFDGNVVWTDQFGSSAVEVADGIAAAQGRILVAGLTGGALPGQTSGGSFDAFIRAYDADGNHVWTRQFGGSGSEDYHAVAADRSGVYAAGSVTPLPDFAGDSDALVVKYDFDGNVVWSRQFGTAAFDHLEGVVVKRGAIYVAGATAGTLPGQTSAGSQDNFLRKYDTDGTEIWTRQFGTSGNDGASFRGLAADGRGVYITGNVAGTLPGQTSAGGRDAFVRQYTHGGDELFTLQFGTSGDDRAIAIAVGENEDLYVGGRTSGAFPGFTNAGGTDGFVTKILTGR